MSSRYVKVDLEVDGNISTYHASAANVAGRSVYSYTDTTGVTKDTIGSFGITQYGANLRRGAFRLYLSNDGAPALKLLVNNNGALGLNVENPEQYGNSIMSVANAKISKAAAETWYEIVNFLTDSTEANPLALGIGVKTSPTFANRHLFIQSAELGGSNVPLILQPSGGILGINTGMAVPTAQVTVQCLANGDGISLWSGSTGYSFLQFYKADTTTVQGSIYGQTGRITMTDAAFADVLTVASGKVGIGTITPETGLHVKGAYPTGYFIVERTGVNGLGFGGVMEIRSDAKTVNDGILLGFSALDSGETE